MAKNFKFIFVFIFLALSISAQAQILQPAKWRTEVSRSEVKAGEKIDLIFYVDIQEDWYLYSTDFDPDLGPMVTEFNFDPDPSYKLVGGIKPVGAKKKYDDIWEGEYTYFTGKAEFRQTVQVLAENPTIEGTYAYQVCTDVDGKCIPFDDEFAFDNITVSVSNKEPENKTDNRSGKSEAETIPEIDAPKAASQEKPKQNKASGKIAEEISKNGDKNNLKENDPVSSKLTGSLGKRNSSDPYSLLGFMLIAFLGGLAALLTPCVFPMIPMTVTFFTSRNNNRARAISKAIIYGLSIIAIYIVAGTVVAIINGPEFANWLSTHWLPNILFFIIFVIFGLSFLGLFDITLPNSIVNKVDQQADKGGYYGVFFMAFTLVLVSFSCTGPIVGSILVEAAGGQIIKPILGMFAFALAFAIPFTLFAVFPEWLNSLPKSGGWLNSVKVVLGFLELAFALKFLSIADQVYHWGILDRDIFLVLWITILSFLGFYLLGKIRLPHDSELKVISVPRLIMAIVTFSFVVYLIPGLFGAPLKALAGYLPPMHTHDYNIASIIRENNNRAFAENDELCEAPKYADMLHFPHGIKGYFDYEQALACAREKNKPLFIDFTGHGCVNCREMEARVWSEPKVLEKLKNDFVMLALYVDEKTELPEEEWYTSEFDGKVKKTIGKQNSDFQISRFNNNAQPYYVILNADGELLAEPESYNLDVQEFVDFLEEGIHNHDQGIIASSIQ